MNRFHLIKSVAAVLVVVVQAHAADPGQVYYANFYNSGGTWTTYPVLSSSPNSWKHGWPIIGPSGPLPDVHSWCTAKNPYTGTTLSGGYYAHEHSCVRSPTIDLTDSGTGWAVEVTWMDYLNVPSGSAAVEVSNNNGLTWKGMFTGSGNQTVLGSWRSGLSRTLSPDFCTWGFRMRFRIDSYAGSYNDYQAYMFDSVGVSLVTPTGSYDVADAYLYDEQWIDYTGPQENDINLLAKTYDDNLVGLRIPADTAASIDGQPLAYDGLYGPWYEDDYYPSDYGIPNPDDVIDLVAYGVGDTYEEISFDNPVRLQFAAQAGKQVGWSLDGVFHPIETMLSDDDGGLLDTLGVDAGYLNVGDDLVVWTDHLCYFVMYTPEPTSALMLGLGGVALLRRRR